MASLSTPSLLPLNKKWVLQNGESEGGSAESPPRRVGGEEPQCGSRDKEAAGAHQEGPQELRSLGMHIPLCPASLTAGEPLHLTFRRDTEAVSEATSATCPAMVYVGA